MIFCMIRWIWKNSSQCHLLNPTGLAWTLSYYIIPQDLVEPLDYEPLDNGRLGFIPHRWIYFVQSLGFFSTNSVLFYTILFYSNPIQSIQSDLWWKPITLKLCYVRYAKMICASVGTVKFFYHLLFKSYSFYFLYKLHIISHLLNSNFFSIIYKYRRWKILNMSRTVTQRDIFKIFQRRYL